jgi:hypothetical protein
MAYQMEFTDEYGEVFAESYWRLEQNNRATKGNPNAHLLLYGYTNAANKGKRIIGQKSYVLDSQVYTEWLSDAAIKDAEKTVDEQAYLYAMASKDTDGVSFFEDAEVV